MHGALRARHSLAMHFATLAGSDVELEQAKREMGGLGEGEGEGVQIVGDWWMEGGMGVVDVGETAVVRVGETALPGPGCFRRSVVAPQQRCERTRHRHDAERCEGDTRISPIHIQNIQLTIYTCNYGRHHTFGNGETTRLCVVRGQSKACVSYPHLKPTTSVSHHTDLGDASLQVPSNVRGICRPRSK